ncbi:MAG: serine/threonine-protein kinase [Pirellulales bacterium]
MESQTLTAKERQHLEEILDQFDRALKDCRSGSLPSVEDFLGAYRGNQLEYLRKEMDLVWREVVRGDYVKIRRLGGGGMGEVFLARHVALGRDFALKEIKLECLRHSDRAEFEKRFRREVEACGRLEHHPNLVNVTNTGASDDGVPYLVMDYIEGLDLKQVVERCGSLPSPVAARIIHDAAAGLAHAHEKGLVHRDIKPSNIMISKHGVVVVLDLGLARVIESDRQASVVSMPGLVGSFDYMSPEQCREEEHVDARADIYALGCTLYFLLAGSPPFAEAKSIFQKLNAHQQDALPELKRDDVDPVLLQALQRMTAKDRDERFASLGEVVALLRPLARDAQLDVLVRHSPERIRDTTESESHSTVAYQTRKVVHTMLAGSLTARGGDASAGSSRFGSATRVIRRQLTRRRFLVIGGLAAVGAATAGGIVWSRRNSAAADFLGTLPGLNGHWWFKEVPWLLPDVRWHLSQSLGFWSTGTNELRSAAEADDVPAFYTALKQRIAEVYREWPEETATRFGLLKTFDPEKLSEEAVNDAVAQISGRLTEKQSQSELDATEWHLLGVMRHHADDFEQAAAAYDSALGAYQIDGNYGLAALCLTDWGQMRLQQNKPVLAQEKFSRARELIFQQSQTSREVLRLFELDALCGEADAHRKYGNWDAAQQSLQLAMPLAESLPKDHPMRAVFHERCGWYHLDVWRVDRAKQEFREALAIRKQNGRDGNDLALHFEWWNRQGQAMVDFYLDEAAASAAALKSLLPAGIEANSQTYTDRQMRELRRRQPNLLERLADAEWIDPATRQDAVADLTDTIRVAENDHFRDDGRWWILIRLKFKLAVFEALIGKPAEAKKRFDEAEKEASEFQQESAAANSTRTGRPGRPPGFDATQRITDACLDCLAADDNVKSAGFERLIEQYKRDPATVTPDELKLLLLVGQCLLERADGSTDVDTQRKLAAEMVRQCTIRARGKPVGEEESDAWRLPKLFEHYRSITAKYVG